MTQKNKVLAQLLEHGSASNYWAIDNYILRLSAIILTLKKEGWNIKSRMEGKNCVYFIDKCLNQIIHYKLKEPKKNEKQESLFVNDYRYTL